MCSLLALCSCRFVSFPIICIFFRFHYFIILFSCLSVLYLSCCFFSISFFFFFNDTAPPEIYPLSLHDALPICTGLRIGEGAKGGVVLTPQGVACLTSGGVHRLDIPRLALFGLICLLTGKPRDIEAVHTTARQRSEEHTSELQSRSDLGCRLLLE